MRAAVGKIVYHYATAGAEPRAAIITHVWARDVVNLTVFPPDELPFTSRSVPHAEDADPDGPRWQWPALTEEGGP